MLEYALDEARARVQRSLLYMKAHLEEPFDLGKASQAAALSPSYFIRVFKRLEGETPGKRFRRLRFAAMDRLIAEDPGRSLTELAMRFGFSSPGALTREFRAFVGSSPSTCKTFFASLRRAAGF